MDEVRLAIIGVGGMGTHHARNVSKVKGATLTAVCDIDAAVAGARAEEFGCTAYHSPGELLSTDGIDAVLIATPHYGHTTIGIEALEAGMHVLVEKPVSVHKADCERLIAAHRGRKQVFAAMFNQRTDPHYRKIKELVDRGELGEITRVNWIITGWFRTDAYYASGGWRATWRGEGGGVLLNQCPHQLDLLQWLCGMPSRIHAFGSIGKHHDIEVEDEVTAFLEYANGATGVFITTTGEAPGTNRLELCGDRGRITVENGKVLFMRNEIGQREFCRTSDSRFGKPPVWNIEIPAEGNGGQHLEVLQNFVDSVRHGTPLIAPAREGIRSVELANAMLYSLMAGRAVDTPLDGAEYERFLKKLIRESRFEKKTAAAKRTDDLGRSF